MTLFIFRVAESPLEFVFFVGERVYSFQIQTKRIKKNDAFFPLEQARPMTDISREGVMQHREQYTYRFFSFENVRKRGFRG